MNTLYLNIVTLQFILRPALHVLQQPFSESVVYWKFVFCTSRADYLIHHMNFVPYQGKLSFHGSDLGKLTNASRETQQKSLLW